MKCTQCLNEYESKRMDSKYCSTNCRVTANRNKGVTDKSVTDNVTLNVTDKSDPDMLNEGDFTRTMVEANHARGELFTPNWYKLGFKSKQECLNSLQRKLA